MKKGLIYFHQGWTDIVICMGLINYYDSLYDEITVLIRSDAKDIIDFYVKPLDSVKVIYLTTDNGRFYGGFTSTDSSEVIYEPNQIAPTNDVNTFVDYSVSVGAGGTLKVPPTFELMCHGEHDRLRKDKYAGYWYRRNQRGTKHFSEAFYTYYDIDFNVRVKDFSIVRDMDEEQSVYDSFIKEHGTNYAIYHDDQTNHQSGVHHVSTKLNFTRTDGITYVNINKRSKNFFDHIKILESAKEIHLVDSVWAAICYQLDAKYGLFKNKRVKIYCERGHYNLFTYPVKLKNWELI